MFIYALKYEKMAPFIELEHVINALQGCVRPLREGREAMKNLIHVGFTLKTTNEVDVEAYCVRLTVVNDDPVKIEIRIDRKTEVVKVKIKSIKCSCASGASKEHVCKHAMATLLFLERNDEENINRLTCTDVEQVWGKLKEKTLSQFNPTTMRDFCHVQKNKSQYRRLIVDLTDEMEEVFRKLYLADQRLSEAALHEKGTRFKETFVEETNCESLAAIVRNAWSNTSYILKKGEEIGEELYAELSVEEQQFYDKFVKIRKEDALQLCLDTSDQCDDKLEKGRYGRVTGSICYGLFTYSKNKSPNWNKKLDSVFNSHFEGNVRTERGLMYEKDAKQKYGKVKKGDKVVTSGLLINPIVLWFGYKADGVVCNEHEIVRLWECKTPAKGKILGPNSIYDSLEYVDKSSKKLKHKHKYYGRIQMGMLLTSLSNCDFTTYCYGFEDIYVENVIINETFAIELVEVLTNCYFKHILPWLYLKSA